MKCQENLTATTRFVFQNLISKRLLLFGVSMFHADS